MRFLIIAFVTIFWNLPAHAQDIQQQRQERHSRYKENAEVHHLDNTASISANSPRPLAQAVTALSEEYAWAIDFEDPPYHSKYDLVDDTAPEWRAAHPTAKGVTVIAGDGFQTQFPKTPDTGTPQGEDTFLIAWCRTTTQVGILGDSASATKVMDGLQSSAHTSKMKTD